MTSENNSLILVGGTGSLGMEIAKGLVTATGYDSCKAIVRNAEKAVALQEMGWTLVELPDFNDTVALEKALTGARTIVSTFGGMDLATLEIATLQAGKKVGATVFVPSQFGVDGRRWNNRSIAVFVNKDKVLEAAKSVGISTLCVYTGCFSDMIFHFLAEPANAKACIIGDGSHKVSFTRRSDIGYVLAKALSDRDVIDKTNGHLSMQSSTVTWKESLELLEKAIGKSLEIEYLDASEALEKETQLLAKGMEGDMGAFFGAFKLHLLGEPARGSTGVDVSAESVDYGVKLQTLQETINECYGAA